MKRVGGLFEQISDRDNLGRALHAASRGKRERREVISFLERGNEELARISQELRRGRFQFGEYHAFEVFDTKTRVIHAPCFRDRVVHHAMMQVLGPIFEQGSLPTSYACRLGRGHHAALHQAAQWCRRDVWYGKMDVEKFYDSVPHSVIQRRLSRRFREKRILDLFDRLLASYNTEPHRGIPIGALTSQYLGNFILDDLDHRLRATAKARRYLRYMDDALVSGSREAVLTIRDEAIECLGEMELRLKHGGEWNRCANGVPFLGFVIYPDRVRLGRQGRRRLRQKWKTLERRRVLGGIGEIELQARGTALFAHAAVGDDLAMRRNILSHRNFGEGQGTTRPARGLLEQHRDELSGGVSQQEPARLLRLELRVSLGCGPRYGGIRSGRICSPEVALSRASSREEAESTGKTLPAPDTRLGKSRKGTGGAPSEALEERGSDA
ncbi:MAG: reverse transcriptase/maturase family protein [Verrucomicrobiota bacterium]